MLPIRWAIDNQSISEGDGGGQLDFSGVPDEIVSEHGTFDVGGYSRASISLAVGSSASAGAALVVDGRRRSGAGTERLAYELGGYVQPGEERPILGYRHGADVSVFEELKIRVFVEAPGSDFRIFGTMYSGGPAGGLYREGTVDVPAEDRTNVAELPVREAQRDLNATASDPDATPELNYRARNGSAIGRTEFSQVGTLGGAVETITEVAGWSVVFSLVNQTTSDLTGVDWSLVF